VELAPPGSIEISSRELKARVRFRGEALEATDDGPEAEKALAPLKIAAESYLRKVKSSRGVSVMVSSKIPMSVGLGSSASTSIATISALSKLFHPIPKRVICNLASDSERLAHGRPSGIDQTVCTYGGMIVYRRVRGFRRLTPRRPLRLVIGNTGVRRSTGEWVGKVARFFADDPQRASALAESAAMLVKKAITAIRRGEIQQLGVLMNENQSLLEEVGVSTPELERLVSATRQAGAYGSKLTGGGGGGCMIAVGPPSAEADIKRAIADVGGVAYSVRTEFEGVR